MASPFSFDRGTYQRRRASADARDGLEVFELGHALRPLVNLLPGDRQDVSQTFVLESQAAFVRPRVRVSESPTGRWLLTVRLNGVVRYSRAVGPGNRSIVLDDIAVSLAGALASPAPNTLLFRLELLP